MIRISIISAIIAVVAFVLGFGVKTEIDKTPIVIKSTVYPLPPSSASPPSPMVKYSATPFSSLIPTVKYFTTPKASPVSEQKTKWIWTSQGCGNTVCVYKVCSANDKSICYGCNLERAEDKNPADINGCAPL